MAEAGAALAEGLLERAPLCQQFPPLVLSVGVAIDAFCGNMRRPGSAEFWKERILFGQVVGFQAAPPCETLTVAREHDISVGPGPVRSTVFPLGIPSATPPERAQLQCGTELLQITLLLFAACMSTNTHVKRSPA